MIVNLLLDVIFVWMDFIVAYMPDTTGVISWINSAAASAGPIGAYVQHANGALPISEAFVLLAVIAAFFPLVAFYRLASWMWRHIPIIAGFGTGNG